MVRCSYHWVFFCFSLLFYHFFFLAYRVLINKPTVNIWGFFHFWDQSWQCSMFIIDFVEKSLLAVHARQVPCPLIYLLTLSVAVLKKVLFHAIFYLILLAFYVIFLYLDFVIQIMWFLVFLLISAYVKKACDQIYYKSV